MSASLPELSRRLLLALPLASGAKAAQTAKVPKAEARYQDQPRGGLRCAACTLFIKPDGCKVVEGPISPMGWCLLFDMAD